MLIQPPSQAPVRVVGIDPGTACMGVSVLEWGFQTPLQVVNAFTIKVANNDAASRAMMELHGHRYARLQQLGETLEQILHEVRPHAVIAESPYLGKFAAAFAALTETFWVIRQTLQAYDPHLPLYSIDPPTAKMATGVKMQRGVDKDDVQLALLARNDIQWQIDPLSLDEHAVDATVVGLYYFSHLL